MSPNTSELEKWIAAASLEALPLVLGDLERLKGLVWVRMLHAQMPSTQSASSDGHLLLTIPQVANRLNIPESRAYELARQHKIQSVRIGKYVRVPVSNLIEYERYISASKK